MPSARVAWSTEIDKGYGWIGFPSLVIPTLYNSKLHIVSFSPQGATTSYAVVYNVENHVLKLLDVDRKVDIEELRPMHIEISGSKVKIFGVGAMHRKNTFWKVWLEVDLSAESATVDVDTKDFDRDFRYTGYNVPIPPNIFITTYGEVLAMIDVETYRIQTYDPGWNGYEPWPGGHKVFIHEDDIYIFIGRHYAGFEHCLLKWCSKSLTKLNSHGGGSPRPNFGGEYVPINGKKDKIVVPLTNGGVNGAYNKIGFYDAYGNFICELDINPAGYSAVNWHIGFHILGKLKDGTYAFIGVESNDNYDPQTEASVVYARIDLVNKNVAEQRVLAKIFSGRNIRGAESSLFGGHSTWAGRPIVDLRNKKVHIFGRGYAPDTDKMFVYHVEIDISDLDVDVWNANAWYIV